jgi:hypothetical protein
MLPRVLDPDSSPQAFRRAGGRSHSLDGRQYSYVIAGVTTGFCGEAMGLKPPWSRPRSCSGTHCVAPEDMTELKAQVEAKFHMFCFVVTPTFYIIKVGQARSVLGCILEI